MFLRWCGRTGTPPELTKSTVQAFTAALLEAGAEPATARTRQLSLKRSRHGWPTRGRSTTNPSGMKPPKMDIKVADALADDELRALIKVPRQGSSTAATRPSSGSWSKPGRAGEVGNRYPATSTWTRNRVVRRGKGGKGRIVPFGRRPPPRSIATNACVAPTYSPTPRHYGSAPRQDLQSPRDAPIPRIPRQGGGHRTIPPTPTAPHGSITRAGRRRQRGRPHGCSRMTTREMLDRYVAATNHTERAAAEARGLNLGDL